MLNIRTCFTHLLLATFTYPAFALFSSEEAGVETSWTLVWSDEFDDPALDPTVWNVEVNDFGGYNNELQYYTDRPENIRLEGGCLILTARKEDYHNRDYTSARINSRAKKSFCYGKIEARMKLVHGTGMWPAFWMMGNQGKWPENGEIDIMELVGGSGCKDCGDHRSYGTLWYVNAEGKHQNAPQEAPVLPGNGQKYSDAFHTFGIEWDETRIVWLIDEVPFHSVSITDPEFSEFHQPFYLLINLAIGGDWPGSPDSDTQFPQEMQVDYVRVFKKSRG